ncbi:hypothetical protein DL93DRAFT_2045616, partial [Clavulina sp. PMI_390]
MSLQSYWQTSLPSSGYEVTSTLVSGTNVYAGSNGYVYVLDSRSGQILQQNNLSGLGNNEVRFALSSDGSTLLVGTDGYILGLNSTSLSTNWQTSLPGYGYNVVNVLAPGGGSIAYAACNGYVYSFTIADGGLQQQNSLSGLGNNEPRLALTLAADILLQNSLSGTGKAEGRLSLRDDDGVLLVGANGYGVAVKATDITTIYQTSLPGCGYNITDVVAGELFTYFGCNGYVYSLDESGNVIGQNALPGLGNHETRLAVSAKADEHVFVGINGYAVGL